MNKKRRQEIEAAKTRIAALQEQAEAIKADLETIRDDEQEYRNNMPESFADGDKGEAADAAISELDDVITDLESFIEADFLDRLDTAAA